LWWEDWLVRGLAGKTAVGIIRPGVRRGIIWQNHG
jgi:hypothetical protein